MQKLKLYDVGGFLRDLILGVTSKDRDYAVVAPSFEVLGTYLLSCGYKIVHVYEDKFTYRCKSPHDSQYYDYVWCRTGEIYDNGKLISVSPGTLRQDLERRDFTINAMARDVDTGEWIDPFNGGEDCKNKVLRTVGRARSRFTEDPRRIVRGIRFIVKYNLTPSIHVKMSFKDEKLLELLAQPQYVDSIKSELDKAFKADSSKTIHLLSKYPELTETLFSSVGHDLHLITSSKKK